MGIVSQVSLTIGALAGGVDAGGAEGLVLFNGPFEPQPTTSGTLQDFELMLPSDFSMGDATLNVFHIATVEVSPRDAP